MRLKTMEIFKTTLLLLFASLFLLSCHKGNTTTNLINSINETGTNFNIGNFSYLISDNGNVVSSYEDTEDQISPESAAHFINELQMPFLLDSLIRDSMLKEDQPVNKYLRLKETNSVYPTDLITVPNSLTDSAFQNAQAVFNTANLLLKHIKPSKNAANNILTSNNLKTNSRVNIKTFFNDINTVSDRFDSKYPFYKNADTNIVNLAPAWYSKNARFFFGWNVLKLQKRTILWKYTTSGSRQFLVIKYLDKGVMIAIGYKDNKVHVAPNDLLQIPFGIAVVKSLLAQPNGPVINYARPTAGIYNQLITCNSSPLYIIYLQELIAYAKQYQKTGKSNQAAILTDIYNKLIKDRDLSAMINRQTLAQIRYVTDNADVATPFEVKTPSDISIFAAGQAITNNDYINAAYQYDNLQIFFNKNVDRNLIVRNENKEFEFNYRYDKIHIPPTPLQPAGWIKDSTIRFAYDDPADNKYNLEIAIPWRRLDCPVPHKGSAIAMNIFIGDSDLEENRRKSILSWTVKSDQDYNDANIFGRINFVNRPKSNVGNNLNSLKTNKPPVIDGIADPIWDQAQYIPINLTYQGTPSPADNSARFKSLYDDQNLYLFFEITDNCKNKTGIVTTDKCWIENAENHEIVWKMNGTVIPGSISFYTHKKIHLPAGKYNLRYTSDNGNSYDGWYGIPPAHGFYGVELYNLTQPIN